MQNKKSITHFYPQLTCRVRRIGFIWEIFAGVAPRPPKKSYQNKKKKNIKQQKKKKKEPR